MDLDRRINAWATLGASLSDPYNETWKIAKRQAHHKNPWFTPENIQKAEEGIQVFLKEETLHQWMQAYPKDSVPVRPAWQVGLVMAGNIPMVGFHDFLSVLLSGHIVLAKLSSQDDVLIQALSKLLIEIEPQYASQIHFVPLLKEAEAYIATGSNNSARYFEYYFSRKPHIIRKNRSSIAVLKGDETPEQLHVLGDDLFSYFGLGCRNVSKLYIPQDYPIARLLDALQGWKHLANHHKFVNNYDYHKAIELVNLSPHLDSGFFILKEQEAMVSPVGMVYYEFYQDTEELQKQLESQTEQIQVIVSQGGWYPNSLDFGQTQKPNLWDYADGVDTMDFLLKLNNK